MLLWYTNGRIKKNLFFLSLTSVWEAASWEQSIQCSHLKRAMSVSMPSYRALAIIFAMYSVRGNLLLPTPYRTSSYCTKVSNVCVVESQQAKNKSLSQLHKKLIPYKFWWEQGHTTTISWKANQQVIKQEGKYIQDLWINTSENELKFINKSEKEAIKKWLRKANFNFALWNKKESTFS